MDAQAPTASPPPPPPPENDPLVRELSTSLYMSRNWLKLIGVAAILDGVMIALTLWGILVCWIPIWMGVKAWQAGARADEAFMRGERHLLLEAHRQLRTYFALGGVVALISLAGVALLLMLVMGGIGLGLLGAMAG